MLTIGLTGGIGTGKSLVSDFLKNQGAALVNADLLGHEAYYPGTPGFQQVGSYGKSGLLFAGEDLAVISG